VESNRHGGLDAEYDQDPQEDPPRFCNRSGDDRPGSGEICGSIAAGRDEQQRKQRLFRFWMVSGK
jgi:hypothetical protein